MSYKFPPESTAWAMDVCMVAPFGLLGNYQETFTAWVDVAVGTKSMRNPGSVALRKTKAT